MMKNNLNCPLCESQRIIIKEILTFSELKNIWEYSRIKDVGSFLPKSIFLLKECQNCNLEFFNSQVGGNENFYSLFKQGDYYQFSWDHKEAAKYILEYKLKSILDYGCGQGDFLDLLPENILKIGIDFNALNKQKNNLKLIKTNLLDFQTKEKFDGIICIQVLEHLEEPRKHLEKIIHLLKKRWLFVFVVAE